MLDFINNNAVLCTRIVGGFSAVLAALVTLIVNRNTERSKEIRSLKDDLKEARTELHEAQTRLNEYEAELKVYKSIERVEQNIDKRHGSVYKEKMPDGSVRDICAYCWETDHKTIPINTEYVTGEAGPNYYGGRCMVCKKYCEEEAQTDLPF